MPSLAMLDVLIGLITIYLTFGLACTAIVEAITAWLGVRSKNLELAMHELFAGQYTADKSFVAAFFDHPIIQSLSKGTDGRPSYIPPELVAKAVESLLRSKPGVTDIRSAVEALPGNGGDNRIKNILLSCLDGAENSAEAFRQAVQMQFDATVSRASGWFKRYIQKVTLAIAMLMVFGANIDTLAIANALYASPEVRLKLVELAGNQSAAAAPGEPSPVAGSNETAGDSNGDDDVTSTTVKEAVAKTRVATEAVTASNAELKALGLPLGWSGQPIPSGWGWLEKLIGILVSGFAVSLGAPFWFDVLKKFMNVRSSAAPTATEQK